MTDVRQAAHRLYAISHSLYSGRARCYLIKQGIAFREMSTGHESFKSEVLPKGKLPTIPTLVTPEGEVVRDGAAIIDHFESSNGHANRPSGPRQQILSLLFDVIGAEGLMRPAMHYRWNFPDQNLEFVRYHFLHSQRMGPAREDKTEHMMNRMRYAGQVFGVTDDTKDVVEALYLDLLDALNKHFEEHAYLLGWRPCIGDFGLIAPLYAHLGRDPAPMALMQQRATRVYRWVERMNRADQDVPEFFDAGSDYLADDEAPGTLMNVLRVISEDFIPETKAAAASINNWLADENPEAGVMAANRLSESIASAEFEVRGVTVNALSQPYRFYLLQRVQACYDEMNNDDKHQIDAMLSDCGMADLMSIRLDRQIGREDNLEVWLAS